MVITEIVVTVVSWTNMVLTFLAIKWICCRVVVVHKWRFEMKKVQFTLHLSCISYTRSLPHSVNCIYYDTTELSHTAALC